jgi:hypothetical protein
MDKEQNMKNALRLAAVLVLAAASTPAFADDNTDEPAATTESSSSDQGSGSSEPSRMETDDLSLTPDRSVNQTSNPVIESWTAGGG